MIICPTCRREWPKDSDQAAAVELYDMCIVCCIDAEKEYDFIWSIEDVISHRSENVRQVQSVLRSFMCDDQ